jgi:hypothetical protein
MDETDSNALALYERCISSCVVDFLQKQGRMKVRRSIYTAQVVIWLMIRQWLHPRGSLATSVAALLTGAADPLLGPCKRARQKRISRRTGGFCQARQRLPRLLCKQVANELVTRLREILNPGGDCRAYLLDGSSLELESRPSLRKLYPPAENQHGRAHWPVLRIVVLHEMETGLSEAPQWGPMYGIAAVSEQTLAEKAMDALAPGSTLVGDRNFGVFSIVWAARQRNLGVVVRLTEARARKLAGGPISEEGERRVTWKASRFDGRRQGGMPVGASVEGRLIAARIGRGKNKEWLYLFNISEQPREQLLDLYGKRWRIETDLRSLKRTVGLHHVAARNESMMEKELLTAVEAYNLVRAVIALAARRHNLSPRQLSFTFVLNVVDAGWHKLQQAPDRESYQREVLSLLDAAAQGVHPKRTKRRSCPRAVWHHGGSFPARKEGAGEVI